MGLYCYFGINVGDGLSLGQSLGTGRTKDTQAVLKKKEEGGFCSGVELFFHLFEIEATSHGYLAVITFKISDH